MERTLGNIPSLIFFIFFTLVALGDFHRQYEINRGLPREEMIGIERKTEAQPVEITWVHRVLKFIGVENLPDDYESEKENFLYTPKMSNVNSEKKVECDFFTLKVTTDSPFPKLSFELIKAETINVSIEEWKMIVVEGLNPPATCNFRSKRVAGVVGGYFDSTSELGRGDEVVETIADHVYSLTFCYKAVGHSAYRSCSIEGLRATATRSPDDEKAITLSRRLHAERREKKNSYLALTKEKILKEFAAARTPIPPLERLDDLASERVSKE